MLLEFVEDEQTAQAAVMTATTRTPGACFRHSRCRWFNTVCEETSLRQELRIMAGLACRMLLARSLAIDRS